MSEFKEKQIVFIGNIPGAPYLKGCRGKIVNIFRKRTGTKRRPIYVEFLYLDTTWAGLRFTRGEFYCREIMVPSANVIAIPTGYKPLPASGIVKSEDIHLTHYDGLRRAGYGSFEGRLCGRLNPLFVRKIVEKKAAAKKTTRKRIR